MIDNCYLCGSVDNLTYDHVPPVGFFPKPRPGNLIKVKCCKSCNISQSADDEAFRAFVSALNSRSPAGEWIWRNKVEGSSFKRSPKLKLNMAKHLEKAPVNLNGQVVEMGRLAFPRERGNNFLIRVTKGLLRHFHPNVNWAKSIFKVQDLRLAQDNIDYLYNELAYDERGDRVFRFWRGVSTNPDAIGIFAYAFYDASLWMVSFDVAS